MKKPKLSDVKYWHTSSGGAGVYFRLAFRDERVDFTVPWKRTRTYVLHTYDTIVKVWTVDYDYSLLQTHKGGLPIRLEAKALFRKMERMYPMHILAKEWPRKKPKKNKRATPCSSTANLSKSQHEKGAKNAATIHQN